MNFHLYITEVLGKRWQKQCLHNQWLNHLKTSKIYIHKQIQNIAIHQQDKFTNTSKHLMPGCWIWVTTKRNYVGQVMQCCLRHPCCILKSPIEGQALAPNCKLLLTLDPWRQLRWLNELVPTTHPAATGTWRVNQQVRITSLPLSLQQKWIILVKKNIKTNQRNKSDKLCSEEQ